MARATTPGERNREMQTLYRRFITPEERKRRIEAAARAAGYRSMNQLAGAMGIRQSTLLNYATRENVSVKSLYRIALKLGGSMAYLTERSG